MNRYIYDTHIIKKGQNTIITKCALYVLPTKPIMWSSRYYCRYVTVGILVARLPALFLKLRCFFFDFWLRKRERHFFSVLFFLFLGGGGGGLSHTLLSLITCGVITLKPSATNPSTPLIKETVALLRSTLLLPTNQTKHKITWSW